MRRLGKWAVGVAAFLVMAGGLLALAGWIMGAERSFEFTRGGMTYYVSPFGITEFSIGSETPEVGATGGERNMAAFADVDVTVDLGAVRFVTAEDYGVALTEQGAAQRLRYEVEDQTLRVWTEESFNLSGNEMGVTATVYLPAGTNLDSVYVHTSLGDVDLGHFSAQDLTVENDMGKVVLTAVTAGTLDLSLNLGNLTALDMTVMDDCTVSSSMGDVALGGTFGDLNVDCSMGDVTVAAVRPKSDYSYSLCCDVGSIRLDGAKVGDGTLDGGGGDYTLDITNSMGDIDVTFGAPAGREADEGEDIVNLPKELYVVCPVHTDKNTGFYADWKSYDFTVEETMVMTIDVEWTSGMLELGIKNRSGAGYAYDMREFSTESDTVELAPGRYRVTLTAEAFQGSYHLTGAAV